MKIETFSQCSDKEHFLKRFGTLPCSLYPERPLPPPGQPAYLIQQFPELEFEFFIASDEDADVARIGCNLSKGHPGIGFFGFFETSPHTKEAASRLIEAAENWLKSKGISTIVGPIDFNVWLSNRFKITDNDFNFSWEPNNPAFYVKWFEAQGYELNQGYISMLYDDTIVSYERTKTAYEAALNEGYTFRNLEPQSPGEIDALYALNTKCFAINYMYEPISKAQYENIHIKAAGNSDMQYSFFISSPEGREIGYVFSYIDDGWHIIKSILMDPAFQGARLASSLVHATLAQARKNGFIKGVGALVRKGNVSERFFDHLQTPMVKSEYTMLKKKL